jgi:hypothetical protein
VEVRVVGTALVRGAVVFHVQAALEAGDGLKNGFEKFLT